jgi:hypothetical protein
MLTLPGHTHKQIKHIMLSMITPTISCIPEWEVFHLAEQLALQTNTTMVFPTKPKTEEIQNFMEDTLLDTELHSIPHTKAHIPRFMSPNLLIKHQRVKSGYTQTIRHAMTAPQATAYLQNKYNWTTKAFHDIQWRAHEKALTFFNLDNTKL